MRIYTRHVEREEYFGVLRKSTAGYYYPLDIHTNTVTETQIVTDDCPL